MSMRLGVTSFSRSLNALGFSAIPCHAGQLGVAKSYWDEGDWAGQTWAAYGQSWYYQVAGSGLRRFISESMHQEKSTFPSQVPPAAYFCPKRNRLNR